ncbi:MAG TPA: hypothetical protein VF338_06550 [Leptolinea sp.]
MIDQTSIVYADDTKATADSWVRPRFTTVAYDAWQIGISKLHIVPVFAFSED